MLSSFTLKICTRSRVFISYSNQDLKIAEEIAQAVKNAGHRVFFDRHDLSAGADFNERIRGEIASSDIFVFILSRNSIREGSYALTELGFARERWPTPVRRVLPIQIDGDLPLNDVPTYLRSVNIHRVEGNGPAEAVALVENNSTTGLACRAVAATSLALLVAVSILAFQRLRSPEHVARDLLLAPSYADLRPLQDPPQNPNDANVGTWADSPVGIILPVTYQHRNDKGSRVRILSETVGLRYRGTVVPYEWLYVVEITEAGCGSKPYCIKGNASAQTLEPGNALSRETLFKPSTDNNISWRRLVREILNGQVQEIELALSTTVDSGERGSPTTSRLVQTCKIDVSALKTKLELRGFKKDDGPLPTFLQPSCVLKS